MHRMLSIALDSQLTFQAYLHTFNFHLVKYNVKSLGKYGVLITFTVRDLQNEVNYQIIYSIQSCSCIENFVQQLAITISNLHNYSPDSPIVLVDKSTLAFEGLNINEIHVLLLTASALKDNESEAYVSREMQLINSRKDN